MLSSRSLSAEQAALPYKWRQTLADVDITVPVPSGTRAKGLTVELKRSSISVGLKGQPPILSGALCREIKVDDSTWTLDDQREVAIHLEKIDQMKWWDSVVQGAPKIDTTKINPDNSKLSDLDGETRAMVEKMMVRRRAVAALTSAVRQQPKADGQADERRCEEARGAREGAHVDAFALIGQFKSAHPEMDFSGVKMS